MAVGNKSKLKDKDARALYDGMTDTRLNESMTSQKNFGLGDMPRALKDKDGTASTCSKKTKAYTTGGRLAIRDKTTKSSKKNVCWTQWFR